MGISDIINTDVIIVEKFSWAIVYYLGLALGSEKCKLKVKISRHSKPNLTTEVKLLEARYCKFLLRSLTKINKRQSPPHIDGTIALWRVELLKY